MFFFFFFFKREEVELAVGWGLSIVESIPASSGLNGCEEAQARRTARTLNTAAPSMRNFFLSRCSQSTSGGATERRASFIFFLTFDAVFFSEQRQEISLDDSTFTLFFSRF